MKKPPPSTNTKWVRGNPQKSGKTENQDSVANPALTITTETGDEFSSEDLKFLSFQMAQTAAKNKDLHRSFPFDNPKLSF